MLSQDAPLKRGVISLSALGAYGLREYGHYRLLHAEAIFRLVENNGTRVVQHLLLYFLPRMRGQTMHEKRVGLGRRKKLGRHTVTRRRRGGAGR